MFNWAILNCAPDCLPEFAAENKAAKLYRMINRTISANGRLSTLKKNTFSKTSKIARIASCNWKFIKLSSHQRSTRSVDAGININAIRMICTAIKPNLIATRYLFIRIFKDEFKSIQAGG